MRKADNTPWRNAFELAPDGVYLDCARQSPRLRALQAAGHAFVEHGAALSGPSLAQYLARAETVRARAASLMGSAPSSVALMPSVAYAISLAARSLFHPSRGQVLVMAGEHPSARLPWNAGGFDVREVRCTVGTPWTQAICEAIDQHTGVVVVSSCQWHDGAAVDLQRVAQAARRHTAALVVDATQGLGVLDIDAAALDADLLVAAGHKWLLGAPGLAYACVASRHHAASALEAQPWALAGGVDAAARADPEALPGAARFDASGLLSSYPLAVADVALTQVADWGIEEIRQQLQAWQVALVAGLDAAQCGHWLAGCDSPHITALAPGRLGTAALRAGLVARGIHVAARGGVLRVSPYLHSTPDDAARLVDALVALAAHQA